MKLNVLSSGSQGNCYIIQNDKEALILDCGVPVKEIKIALNFNIKKVVGALVTHCHKDHDGYSDKISDIGIPVLKPFENPFKVKKLGGFTIRPFELVHDVPCYGFHIAHDEIGILLYATDTEYIKYRFKDINHMLVEANYSKDILASKTFDESEESYAKREHVLTGHMELQTTLDFIEVNNHTDLVNVILCHLSHSNADNELFKAMTYKVARNNVYVAEKGLCVELTNPNEPPF